MRGDIYKKGKANALKKTVSLPLTVVMILAVIPVTAAHADGELTVSEAARLIRGFEETYLMTVESNKAPNFRH